jgi:predicted XRE-type DNA-binding protein
MQGMKVKVKIKIKIKFTLEQATMAQRGLEV